VLLAIHGVRHGTVDNLRAEVGLPEERPRARVERLEIAFAVAGKEDIRRGGQDPAIGDVGGVVLPPFLARARIDRLDGAVAGRLGPVVDRTALYRWNCGRSWNGRIRCVRPQRRTSPWPIWHRHSDAEVRSIVLPCRYVEQAGAGAEGRRVPVRPPRNSRVRA